MKVTPVNSDPKPVLQKPLVTFLVPCYNYGNYLRSCIDSIASQTYRHIEILILDDASTDNTPEIARKLTESDDRIRYRRNEQNIGHLANYNRGIEEARGELIWLISADDCLAVSDVLADFVRVFETRPNLGYAFCRVQVIDENSQPRQQFVPRQGYAGLPDEPVFFGGHPFFRRLIKANFVPAPSTIARKACYEEYGLFHPALTHSGDWYNWLLFSLGYDVYYDPSPRVFYRKHSANMHRTYEKPAHAVENSLLCYREVQKKLLEHKAPQSLRWLTRLAVARFKRQHNLPLSPAEKLTRLSGKLVSPLIR